MIMDALRGVILRELDLDDFELDPATVASQVPGWDSLNHSRIVAAVEAEFGVRFRGLEIMQLRNVGDLQRLLDRKLAEKASGR